MTPRRQSILIGAIVIGLLSTSYLSLINLVCCLGVFIGSILAVQQYTVRASPVIEAGDGAVIGALAGGLGAIIGSLLNLLLRPIGLDATSATQPIMQDFVQGMMGEQAMSPEMMQQSQQAGGVGGFLFSLVTGLIVSAIIGAIGGAIGTLMFGEEEEVS